MKYDAVIFDVDGTLWDARVPAARAWSDAYREITGRERILDPVELGSYFGIPTGEIIRIVLPELPPEAVEPFSRRCYELCNAYCRETPGKLYPGVRETISALSARYPLYIVSNCQKGYIEALVQGCGFTPFFSGWSCWEETKLPKAGTLRLLMERNGLKNPLYVGDTAGDVAACKEAGLDIAGVTCGLGDPVGATVRIGCISELLELL